MGIDRRVFEGAKVLVVDEQRTIRRIIAAPLKELGAEISEAAGCIEAAAMLKEFDADLAVVELAQQGQQSRTAVSAMTGVGLLKAVRAGRVGRNRFMPMLIMTAAPTSEAVLSAMRAGANGVVAKPIAPATLRSKAAAALAERTDFAEVPDAFGEGRHFFGPLTRWSSGSVILGRPHLRHSPGDGAVRNAG